MLGKLLCCNHTLLPHRLREESSGTHNSPAFTSSPSLPSAVVHQQAPVSPPFQPQPQPQQGVYQAAEKQQWNFPASPGRQTEQSALSSEPQGHWEGPVTDLVTYELELDTGQQQVPPPSCHSVSLVV